MVLQVSTVAAVGGTAGSEQQSGAMPAWLHVLIDSAVLQVGTDACIDI